MWRLEVAEGVCGCRKGCSVASREVPEHWHHSVAAYTDKALSKLLRHLSPNEPANTLWALVGHSVTAGLGMTNVPQ